MTESSNSCPRFTPPGQWAFTRWRTTGQLDALEVRHPLFQAAIVLQGAHLISFAPQGQPDWLWLSDTARFEPGRAIRGGVPLCWPWFGDPARNAAVVRQNIHTDTAHGFARTALWQLGDVRESAHEVEISLALDANSDFADIWSGRALVLATFHFSVRGCRIALTTTNLDSRPLALTQALHSYFPTTDLDRTRILGLEQSHYHDAANNWNYRHQQGPVTFAGETDRVYESAGPVTLTTPSASLDLNPVGSDSTVVWNPGPDKAARLTDFPAKAWKTMVCVETANAVGDYRVLNNGQSHTLGVLIGRSARS